MLWMRENGCRDNPSGAFSGETTQIHSIPAFSSTIGPRTLGCQFMCMSYVPLVCLSVYVSTNYLFPMFLKSSSQTLALTSCLHVQFPFERQVTTSNEASTSRTPTWDWSPSSLSFLYSMIIPVSNVFLYLYIQMWAKKTFLGPTSTAGLCSTVGLCPTRNIFFRLFSMSLKIAIFLPLSSLHSWDEYCDSTCLYMHVHLDWWKLFHRSKEVVGCLATHTHTHMHRSKVYWGCIAACVALLECYYRFLCVFQVIFPSIWDRGCPSVCMLHGSDAESGWWTSRVVGQKEVKRKWVDTSSPHGLTPGTIKRGRFWHEIIFDSSRANFHMYDFCKKTSLVLSRANK